jgi:membrane-bound serine protease (ClpP class)
MRKKVTNEAAAYLRTITEKRGRDTALAEKAVTEAKAFTEKEALAGKLIDLIVPTTDQLLQQLDGREIRRFDGSTMKLELKNPVRQTMEMNTKQRILTKLTDPDVMFVLMLLAALGIYVEFTHPGLYVPGIVGGASLLAVLFAWQVIPVSALGVILIVGAIALFVMEAKFTSHGLLGLAGALCMIAGALFLVKSPMTGWGVSLSTAITVTAPFALISIFIMRKVIQSYSWKPSTGMDEMLGEVGEVTEAVSQPGAAGAPGADGMSRGMAFVHGELWRVASRTPIPKGAHVRVTKVDGLTLVVEPQAKS